MSSLAQPLRPNSGSGIGVTFLKQSELMKNVGGRRVPLDAEVVFQNLSRYDAVWYSQIISRRSASTWNHIRKYAPKKLMLFYKCSVTSRIKSKDTLDYDYINTYHPEWFLLKDSKDPLKADVTNPDNRIRRVPNDKNSRHYNRFYVDVCNSEFQEWAAQRILRDVSGKTENFDYPYDGLAFDNVVLRKIKVRFNKPYPNWKYANDIQGWKDGYLRYLRKVRKVLADQRYILVVNFSFYWELERNDSDLYDLMDTVDGIMHEWAMGYGPDATGEKNRHWGGRKWLRVIKRHEAIAKKGLIDWWTCYPSEEPELGNEQFRYAYCSFLLVKKRDHSIFYASANKGLGSNREAPWYDEYNLPIGEPTSERYLKDDCLFRDYTNARIIVNPTDVSRKVVIDKNKLWVDWTSKKAVNELALPPKSGRILLVTPYKARSQIPDSEKWTDVYDSRTGFNGTNDMYSAIAVDAGADDVLAGYGKAAHSIN